MHTAWTSILKISSLFRLNNLTMIKHTYTENQVGVSYVTPACRVHAIQPEGALCISVNLLMSGSSIEQLQEYDSEYEWY